MAKNNKPISHFDHCKKSEAFSWYASNWDKLMASGGREKVYLDCRPIVRSFFKTRAEGREALKILRKNLFES